MTCECSSSCVLDCFTISQPREVKIRSWTLCSIYWFGILLVILGWIFGYMMIYNRGWEKRARMESVVTTKLHGLAYTDDRVWDNAELMVPPKENGAFTVITSLLETPQQNGTCEEDPNVLAALCTNDTDCPPNQPVFLGNGVRTGQCVNVGNNSSQKVCMIRAWCPVEIDHPSKRIRMAHENFTVSIRNLVTFPLFDETRKNFDESMTAEELSTCIYDENDPINRNCPVFNVATIVKKSGHNFEEMVEMGGVIEMTIDWDCTFGFTASLHEECRPEYSFHRLDKNDPDHTKGFHLRYTERYEGPNGIMRRTLYRAYGIRVIVAVYGRGWKFNWGNFFFTFGSGFSYFTLVAIAISYCLRGAFLSCWPCDCTCFRSPDNSNNRHQTLDAAIFTDFLCCDTHKAKENCCCRRRHRHPSVGGINGHQPRDVTTPTVTKRLKALPARVITELKS